MLETDALNGVGQLDVDAEIVRVQLQPVVGRESGLFAHIHRKRRDRAVDAELPMLVVMWVSFEADGEGGRVSHSALEIERSFKLLYYGGRERAADPKAS